MMNIFAFGRGHQSEHARALAEGLKVHGIRSEIHSSLKNVAGKYVACWGWRAGKQLRAMGKEVLVMERGYLGDRFSYSSLCWNGLNGHGEFPVWQEDNGERFSVHNVQIKPWKKDGKYALILGQVPKDASLQGLNMIPWYEEKARQIKEHYDIPVYFRPHPDCVRKGIRQHVEGTLKSAGSLQDALDGSLFTVCYNSNSSVESVLNGVPCVVGDKGTMAYDVCSDDYKSLKYADREKWAYSLAWTQWTIPEIASGIPLKPFADKINE